jgi:hypothetical protein
MHSEEGDRFCAAANDRGNPLRVRPLERMRSAHLALQRLLGLTVALGLAGRSAPAHPETILSRTGNHPSELAGDTEKPPIARSPKVAHEGLIPGLVFIASGAAFLAAGLSTQLAVYDRHTSENPFRYANYFGLETIFAVSGIVILIALILLEGDVWHYTIPAALFSLAAVYGVFGWKYRDNEAMYYASTSTASSLLVAFGASIVFD